MTGVVAIVYFSFGKYSCQNYNNQLKITNQIKLQIKIQIKINYNIQLQLSIVCLEIKIAITIVRAIRIFSIYNHKH